ncbi:hypothetical protein [Erythrobacter sanguineus]|uniref:hypothetical protein n=1 Tax=Erythrobacter sanguineus TaxID=198312 RepID=UPI00116045FB|nr:hypothetical protein [Erythrobacter sanguineus]
MNNSDEYRQAQLAIAELKAAVLSLLRKVPSGMSNAAIGRSLGIYAGHKGHEGHISRTLLAMLEAEGLVQQNADDQHWSVRSHQSNKLMSDRDHSDPSKSA